MAARRAVKTIQEDFDLSGVLYEGEQVPKVWNPAELFGNNAPVELEIGSGKGLFISNAAKNTPEHNFLGIEIGKKYARFCAAGIIRAGIIKPEIIRDAAVTQRRNAVMFCADAAEILRSYIPENALEAVHVYFPDPWWKRPHRKRRILRTEVLQIIESRLRIGGVLHFWTDVEEYFNSTLQLLKEHTAMLGPFEVAEKAAESESDYRTHFERRTRLHQEKVYRAEFRKGQG